MIDPQQLLDYVIRPVNKSLDLWSIDADKQVLGTACQETQCGRYLHQIGGPALGIFQMEAATYYDLLKRFLVAPKYSALAARVKALARNSLEEEMIGNLYYATAICRLKYLSDPDPIPSTLPEQAAYWKRVYNTLAGAGTVDEYIANWNRYASGVRF